MQIYIKFLAGLTLKVEAYSNDLVATIKAKIHEQEDIAPELQRIVCTGRILEDCRRLSYYNVTDGSVLHLFYKLSDCNEAPSVSRENCIRQGYGTSGGKKWHDLSPGLNFCG